ncbi:MAG: zinc dependent phospholipase C family protein [Deltaproteobacteria bacterium]|nr:zinc dependent phospholipase C family protein [Deltaproteobacteria bacterium]
MILMVFILIIPVIAILFLPHDVFAWGPATHLEIGLDVLGRLHDIPHGIAALIGRFPFDFLYGNISADIVVGKNLVEELKHCHNWSFGFRLLKKARSDSQRAFAYGYLSHLAADCVAHNNFIPEMMIRSFSSRILRHGYWELRFDILADRRVWRVPEKIARSVHRDNDLLLKASLEDTPLSFRTNKTIFSGILNLSGINRWHRMLAVLSSRSRWALHVEDKNRFIRLATGNVRDILADGKLARCVRADPTGRKSLQSAKSARKRLKTVRRRGGDWQRQMEAALADFSAEKT